jgi:hypothetical protein
VCVCVCVCVCLCVNACMYVHLHMYVCMYIQCYYRNGWFEFGCAKTYKGPSLEPPTG